MKSAKPPAGYRRGVGVMLIDDRRRVFVGRRLGTEEGWQMPQGGIDGAETPHAAALRELKEEIGTDKAEFVAESTHWLSYEFPAALRPSIWGGRYAGQTQKWFLMRFTGADADIDLDAHMPEFDAWKWIAPDELPVVAIDFKQALYRALLEEFAEFLGRR
ncbi:MAG: RNA pyrophosphohydrolase [Alphaproteobacteria bacterium]|nr:RNA pyrophosphohydrolase [Alphaproteobacteria bacterium]MDE1967314.1 RNA pyrophosphohydrolase [Alphaproteobacteria bacterium]